MPVATVACDRSSYAWTSLKSSINTFWALSSRQIKPSVGSACEEEGLKRHKASVRMRQSVSVIVWQTARYASSCFIDVGSVC